MSAAETLLLLEAAGRAVTAGAAAPGSVAHADVESALSSDAFDLSELEDAAMALARVVELARAGEDEAASETAVRDALRVRDRVEHVLLAAERALGRAPALTREQQIFVVQFEEVVRPVLHRLTAFNDVRGEMAAAVAPAWRGRFWWSCEGAGIAPTAAASLAEVAELIARFPEARRELEAMVSTARTLRSAGAPAAPVVPVVSVAAVTPVTSLAAWAKSRRAAHASTELRIAAASDEERIELARTAAYDVSWRLPSSIVVDIHVDPREGATPHARLASGRVLASTLVPRTIHRYAIAIDDAALVEERLLVVIPLPSGDVEIPVPSREP